MVDENEIGRLATARVTLRFARTTIFILCLIALYYLGMTALCHALGACLTSPPDADCVGPYYHARHIPPAIFFSLVIVLICVISEVTLGVSARFRGALEREKAVLHERAKAKELGHD